MKKYNSLFILSAVLLVAACNTVELQDPVFEVTTDKTTAKVGEDVTFTFGGEPVSNIYFYSGEAGKEYDNRARTAATGAINQLVFTSNVTATGQAGNLALMVSSDFSGVMDTTNIRKATWTDVTNKATLGTTTTSVGSGNIDLSSFQNPRDTLFVAFRYKSTPATVAASVPRAWTVGGFVFTNIFPNGATHVQNTLSTDIRRAGFQAVNIVGDSLTWAIGGSLTFKAGKVNQTQGDEDWAISQPFKLSKIAPDVAVGLQNAGGRINNYIYKFTKAGTYKATFVASNTDATGVKEITKDVTITVTQ